MWTAHHWQHWLARGNFPDHRWRSHLERSALTLKGLTFAPTGALAAAATTSLPESQGGERNWDYRFTWIRDSTFALWGLYTLGFDWEADDFFCFISDVAKHSDELQVMYSITGERHVEERILDHLNGYNGARPVRVGNGAFTQAQHDVWGAMLDSFFIFSRSRDRLDERIWPILERQVESAIKHWPLPDQGMWEVRGEPKHFTSSKMMCWVATDRGARLARIRERHDLAARWQKVADEIHAEICERGVDERGVFTQHYDTDALDASLLLMPLVGFLPPDDPRVRATVLAIADELTVEGLVLRYRVKETDDGLSGEEGSFAICSFWLVSALVQIGENLRARQLCEKMLSLASPLDLYAEEIDPLQRPSPRQLPPGVHPPGAHQRGDPRDPDGRADGAVHVGASHALISAARGADHAGRRGGPSGVARLAGARVVQGERRQLGTVAEAQLAERPRQVRLHRVDADEQRFGDLRVAVAEGGQGGHLALPLGQPRLPPWPGPHAQRVGLRRRRLGPRRPRRRRFAPAGRPAPQPASPWTGSRWPRRPVPPPPPRGGGRTSTRRRGVPPRCATAGGSPARPTGGGRTCRRGRCRPGR